MIEQMEAQARLQLAGSTAAKPKACVAATHKGYTVEILARVLRTGKELIGYSYDGIRLERSVLLQLLCTETVCPQCQLTQKNWRAFRGESTIASPPSPFVFQFRHLAEEVNFELKGISLAARPAALQCLTVCPAGIHSPTIVKRAGWDLFCQGSYLAGGITINADASTSEPMFPSLEDARRWLVSNLTATSQTGE